MPSQCLCRQRQREIGLRRGDVITEAENAVMQPEVKGLLELEEVRNKATLEPPDQSLPTCCCSVTQSCPTLQPHGPQHARLPCSSASPMFAQTCSFSWWCHPSISSSVIPFPCLQSFPASGSFPMNRLFASGSQSVGASASVSVFPMSI